MEEVKDAVQQGEVLELRKEPESTEHKINRILVEHFKYDLKAVMISSIDAKGIIHTDVVFEDGLPFANLLLMQKTIDIRMDELCKTSLGEVKPSQEEKKNEDAPK